MAGSTTVITHSSTSPTISLVSFLLGGQVYALPLDQVVQIIPMVSITRLPQLLDSMLGVINVRGMVVPMVDLRKRFGLPDAAFQLYTPIILATVSERLVGFVVDDVADVLTVPQEQVARLEQVLPQELGQAPVLLGVIQHKGVMIPLVAPEQLFLPDQAKAIEAIVQTISADGAVEIVSAGAQAEATSTGRTGEITPEKPQEGEENTANSTKSTRRRKPAKSEQTGSEAKDASTGAAAPAEKAAAEENVSRRRSNRQTRPDSDNGASKAPQGGGIE